MSLWGSYYIVVVAVDISWFYHCAGFYRMAFNAVVIVYLGFAHFSSKTQLLFAIEKLSGFYLPLLSGIILFTNNFRSC